MAILTKPAPPARPPSPPGTAPRPAAAATAPLPVSAPAQSPQPSGQPPQAAVLATSADKPPPGPPQNSASAQPSAATPANPSAGPEPADTQATPPDDAQRDDAPSLPALHVARSRSVVEAEMALAYAAEHGVAVEGSIMKTIAQSADSETQKNWTPDSEAAFWSAFQALTKSIAPVTIQSIRASSAGFGRPLLFGRLMGLGGKHSAASITAMRFRIWAIVALALLLAAQAYWISTSTAITEFDRYISRIEKLNKDLDERIQTLASQGAKIETDPKIVELKSRISALRADITFAAGLFENIGIGVGVAKQRKALLDSDTDPDKQFAYVVILRNEIEFVASVLSLYVLPLLYGFIGACAYVLRNLSDEIRAVSYTESSDIDYRLRIYLGAVAGFVIALFLAPNTGATPGTAQATASATEGAGPLVSLQQISPFALSFLAGYSVELLFSTIDRILKTLTSRISGPEEKP